MDRDLHYLESYPKYIIELINSYSETPLDKLLKDHKYVCHIYFETNEREEYNYYESHNIETKMGGDCSMYFKNNDFGGLSPSAWGNCTASAWLFWIKDSAVEKLKQFVDDNIWKIKGIEIRDFK